MDNIVLEDFQDNERIIFHFNKASLADPTIPFWTVKRKGKTYYVNDLESTVGFRTKNTPDNEATKGSIQFKGKLKIEEIDGKVIAYIT